MSDTVGPSSSTPVPSDPQLAAAETLRLATAYQASRALHVALRMSIPDLLADGPRSLEDLARNTGSHALSLRRLLRALAAYQPVDEVLNWSSTHNMSGPNLRRATLCSGLIAEQRLRQRAVSSEPARACLDRPPGRV